MPDERDQKKIPGEEGADRLCRDLKAMEARLRWYGHRIRRDKEQPIRDMKRSEDDDYCGVLDITEEVRNKAENLLFYLSFINQSFNLNYLTKNRHWNILHSL